MNPPIDWTSVEVLTFDCYGTLIDWEAGISRSLGAILSAHGVTPTTEELLETYAIAESRTEAGGYLAYREVLRRSARFVCARFGVRPRRVEVEAFASSLADWPVFPDSRASLARLAERFQLGVITNCDDDLFAASNQKLGEPFTWVVTAQQARSYKPSLHNFAVAFETMGLSPDEARRSLVHVAQSLYHDHGPAAQLGLRSVWVDRRHDIAGTGATPPANARPTLIFPSMAAFTDAALAG